MKRLFWIGLILSCTTWSRAWGPPDGSFTPTSDTRTVSVSTTAGSPTLLLTQGAYIQRTWILNTSSCTVFVSTASNNISIATSFGIKGSATAFQYFTPDGVNAPYWGQLYGLSNCAGASDTTISIWRVK